MDIDRFELKEWNDALSYIYGIHIELKSKEEIRIFLNKD